MRHLREMVGDGADNGQAQAAAAPERPPHRKVPK
jgi:hypothetical protein